MANHGKRAGFDDFDMKSHGRTADAHVPAFLSFELGDGTIKTIPTKTTDSNTPSPNFTGVRECKICGGQPEGTGFIGGLIPRMKPENGLLYKFMYACPVCVFGAWWKKYHDTGWARLTEAEDGLRGQNDSGGTTSRVEGQSPRNDDERHVEIDSVVRAVASEQDLAF